MQRDKKERYLLISKKLKGKEKATQKRSNGATRGINKEKKLRREKSNRFKNKRYHESFRWH